MRAERRPLDGTRTTNLRGSRIRGEPKPHVRKTPYGHHLYVAALRGQSTYGWGNTPHEARTKLTELLARPAKEMSDASSVITDNRTASPSRPAQLMD